MNQCIDCGATIHQASKRCSPCYHANRVGRRRRRWRWRKKEEALTVDLDIFNFCLVRILRKKRISDDLSQKDLAVRIGWSSQFLQGKELRRHHVSAVDFCLWCKALALVPGDVFTKSLHQALNDEIDTRVSFDIHHTGPPKRNKLEKNFAEYMSRTKD